MPTGLRIGVDFGTSTTQVAVFLDGRAPQLLRLEDLTDHMPSYYAVDTDGTPRFGAVAVNLPDNVHSIKPLLADDVEIEGVGYPSKLAYQMLQEVVRRTILRLREQRLIPADLDRLDVATNLGCTPAFELDARIRLRDVAGRAGLNVQLASLIEEPVAAAYEIMLSGLVTDGRMLVVDMGGGTLDTAVIRISRGARSFELFSSGGSTRAGDRFTEAFVEAITSAVRSRTSAQTLTRSDLTLIWQRAEAAKQSLSARRTAVIPLGGIADIRDETFELDRDWFIAATRNLRVRIEADVANVYRMARLVLDRGGEFDPAPGTTDFEERTKGRVRTLSQIGLRDDAPDHIDAVVLVGGATNMPMIGQLFRSIFGDRVIEPELIGIDRSAIVAMGLARPKPPEITNMRYPNWGVSAVFAGDGQDIEVPLYEPFAPTFQITHGTTAEYRHLIAVPDGARTMAVAFRQIGNETGVRWPTVDLPEGALDVTFELNLFGKVSLYTTGDRDVYQGGPSDRPDTPWMSIEGHGLASWLPPWKEPDWWKDMPTWDLRNDK